MWNMDFTMRQKKEEVLDRAEGEKARIVEKERIYHMFSLICRI